MRRALSLYIIHLNNRFEKQHANLVGDHLPHNGCKDRSYTTVHVWNKTLMCHEKERWPPSISLVLRTATIHTIVTNSSQPLMESIKPCKYLQDKRASRQSIPIYRTMEGSTVAVFQVRKINKVSFGNRRKKINNNLIAVGPLSLSLKRSLPPSSHHSDPCVGSSFFFLLPPHTKFDIAGCTSQQVPATAGGVHPEGKRETAFEEARS